VRAIEILKSSNRKSGESFVTAARDIKSATTEGYCSRAQSLSVIAHAFLEVGAVELESARRF
jgi:hypothetical protein